MDDKTRKFLAGPGVILLALFIVFGLAAAIIVKMRQPGDAVSSSAPSE